MRKDDGLLDGASGTGREIDRRTIAKGVAWTVPVVIVATAAPAAAAVSPDPVIPMAVTLNPSGGNGTITINFDNGSPNQSVRLKSVSGANETWILDANSQNTTSSATAGCSLTFTCGRRNSGNLTGAVTVEFEMSVGAAVATWKAEFDYNKEKVSKTMDPFTV
jgi:hypothetical protein